MKLKILAESLSDSLNDHSDLGVLFYLLHPQAQMPAQQFVRSKPVGVFCRGVVCDGLSPLKERTSL